GTDWIVSPGLAGGLQEPPGKPGAIWITRWGLVRLSCLGELAVRIRPLLLSAASAAAGLALIGSVVAQPPAGMPGQPKMSSGSGGTLPATTVRPYSEGSPNLPPGYTPKVPPVSPPGPA